VPAAWAARARFLVESAATTERPDRKACEVGRDLKTTRSILAEVCDLSPGNDRGPGEREGTLAPPLRLTKSVNNKNGSKLSDFPIFFSLRLSSLVMFELILEPPSRRRSHRSPAAVANRQRASGLPRTTPPARPLLHTARQAPTWACRAFPFRLRRNPLRCTPGGTPVRSVDYDRKLVRFDGGRQNGLQFSSTSAVGSRGLMAASRELRSRRKTR
jgi:hypothetical protein